MLNTANFGACSNIESMKESGVPGWDNFVCGFAVRSASTSLRERKIEQLSRYFTFSKILANVY
jgi:hypothetical protein